MIQTQLIQPLGELIQNWAKKQPNKIAFEDWTGAEITYKQLELETRTLACQMRSLGIKIGDAVAVLLPNSVDWAVASFAITRAGAVCVPISHNAVAAEIRYRLRDSKARAIIVSKKFAQVIGSLKSSLPDLQLIIGSEADEYDNYLSLMELKNNRNHEFKPVDSKDLDACSYIIYTSGTTGQAKGVMLSLRNMLWVTAACWAPITGLKENDVILSPLPLFHSYAVNLCILSVVATGSTVYLLDKFSPSEILKKLETGRFSIVPGVPTMFHYLLETWRTQRSSILGVRYFISAGAIMPAKLNSDFEQAFGVPLLDGYGITETATMVTMNWPNSPRKMGSCGLALPGLMTRIVDTEGADVGMEIEGELIVRGPNVMLGYFDKAQETALSLANGWYHTGDLAKFDKNGFITITGRVKELIIRGGENISPAEVEDAIASFPSVLDCAVLGEDHPELGKVPIACVVLRNNEKISKEALIKYCSSLLSAYKLPERVYVVSEIPRTGSGKIVRFKLRETLKEMTPLAS